MSSIILRSESALQPDNGAAFDELAAQVERTVAPSSARVYRQTYDVWRAFCRANGLDALDLRPSVVIAFLTDQDTTKATRQRQLSAMRKLAQMLYILKPTDDTRRLVEALKVTKAPAGDKGSERTRKALTPAEADKMLRIWNGATPADARNRALVAVLLLGGIRRSEAAGLRWRDVDFENGVLHVRHGKGDKARDVPLAGDYALDALRRWQLLQPSGYEWVFTPVERGGKVGRDRPLTGTDVYRIWNATAGAAGVESKPHDARRTFITEALATGTPLATVQAAAGHQQGETTLRYAQAVDARRARKELRLRYG
jgi:integrase/recombinase XerD